jgi:hypothetical protein
MRRIVWNTVAVISLVITQHMHAQPSAVAPWETVTPALMPAEREATTPVDLGQDAVTATGISPTLSLKPAPTTRSNDISIEGPVSTQVMSSSLLNLQAERVANNRSGGTSGTLRLTIWATLSRPSYGTTISGYRLGYYQFTTTLQAGYYFSSVNRNVTYAGDPPNGTYYITMTADEYSSSNNSSVNDGFAYKDLVVMNSTLTFGAATTCSVSLSSPGATISSNGGSGSVSVTSGPSGCTGSWSASSNSSWITILSGASGSGAGSTTLTYSVAATSAARTGSITAGGKAFTISQSAPSAASCSYGLSGSGATFAAAATTGSVGVTGSPSACSGSWSASSNSSWISVTSGSGGSGSGSWSVTYSVAANSSSSSRTGSLTIAGQTFQVTQQGGSFASCTADAATLCLASGRFAVTATWETSDGSSGQGHASALTSETGYFWFFNSSNVEVVVKVLNACSVNSRIWVFAGGLTNVKATITVRDTQTGGVRTYSNPMNAAFQPIQDVAAFATCP